jgi:predicted dehydrogenase
MKTAAHLVSLTDLDHKGFLAYISSDFPAALKAFTQSATDSPDHEFPYYFLGCIEKGTKPTRVTAETGRDALRVAWAEIASVRTGRRVALR